MTICFGIRQSGHTVLSPGMMRIGPAINVLGLLREFEVDPHHLLLKGNLSVELFEDPENLISYDAFGTLLTCCVAATGCDHFGLFLGSRAGFSSLGRVGFAARNALDVSAALQSVIDYF